MDDPKKDDSNPKRPPQRNCLNRLSTHNVPNDDVENINGTK